jgi:hypothetical protein
MTSQPRYHQQMWRFAPPAPFALSFDIDATTWIDDALNPRERLGGYAFVGEIVPDGFEA